MIGTYGRMIGTYDREGSSPLDLDMSRGIMALRNAAQQRRRQRIRFTNVTAWGVGVIAGLTLCAAASTAAVAPAAAGTPLGHRTSAVHWPATARPWVEGVDPAMENRLFYATYGALESHNVLKVYAFSAGGYESAGIRFSARVPHEARDLTLGELAHESALLIRTTFDGFPEVEQLDVWATIPVAQSLQTSEENTVFSVSADRETYERMPQEAEMTDLGFLNAFGRVWVAPQVPR